MKPWLILIVAAIIGGIGGYILGKTSSSGNASSGGDTVLLQQGSLLGSGGPSVDGSTASRPDSGQARAAREKAARLEQNLKTIKSDSNPVNRLASLTQLLGDLAPENLETVLRAFDEIPMRNEHRQEYQMLVYAWAAFDPEGAMKFIEENANKRSIPKDALLKPLLASWASNDPEQTLEWINTLPEDERKNNALLSGLMEGWAVKDPYAAAEYLQANVEAGKSRENLAGTIASHLFKQDPAEAARWAEAQTDLKFREEAFEELAEDWGSVNPRELATWLEKHVDQEYSVEAFEDLARAWVSQDPEAATTYFENLPDGAAKESGIYEMAVTWGGDDLLGLGQWLNGLPDSNVTDLGVKAYVERLSRQAPEAAIDSALSINTDEIRNEAVQNVGQQWYRQDPAAATAWAQANGVPVETFQSGNMRGLIDGQAIPEHFSHQISEALERGVVSPDQISRMMEMQARAVEQFQKLDGAHGGDTMVPADGAAPADIRP